MSTQPNYAVPTGDYVAEWMDDNGVIAAELGRRLGVSRKHVSELLSGKAPLSRGLAISLQEVTSIPARIWNQYEALYREDLARIESDAAYAAQYEEAKAYPLAHLRKSGHISAGARDRAGTVKQVLALFGVASFDALRTTWSEGNVAYRRSVVTRQDAAALQTWLALGERAAEQIDVAEFDKDALRAVLPDLRALSATNPATYVAAAVTALAGVGVSLCFERPMPGLGIHGATRWVGHHPVVQLSLLYKADDQLWFTLFHELGHVLLHGEDVLYLTGENTSAEDEANTFAADTLIPLAFVDRLPRDRDSGAIRALADELGIAPGIVLGRAQWETGDYAWGHSLKTRFDFTTGAEA